MIINVHGGHNPDGKIACGAIGVIKESTEDRKVKDLVIAKLRALGHVVYDCTVDDGKSQNDVLRKIVKKCNSHQVDLDVSIHFNSGAYDKKGNGETTGTEVWIRSKSAVKYAQRISTALANGMGLENRGVQYSRSLYFLNRTNAPALLVEVCFVDDADDVKHYNAEVAAKNIVEGITGQTTVAKAQFLKDGLDYSLVFEPVYYANNNPDVAKALGTNSTVLFNHFYNNGMKEGRVAIKSFNVRVYKANNEDLKNAFGDDWIKYFKHYISMGHNENRKFC